MKIYNSDKKTQTFSQNSGGITTKYKVYAAELEILVIG